MADSLVPVAVACPCPGTPHSDGDTVFLAPFISLAGGLLAEALMVRSWKAQDASGKFLKHTQASLKLEAELREVYAAEVQAWTFVDANGEDIEVTETSIRDMLNNFAIARPVGDKADQLYSKSVMVPLVARTRKSLQSSQRRASTLTSVTPPSDAKPRKRSKRSPTSTTDEEPLSA